MIRVKSEKVFVTNMTIVVPRITLINHPLTCSHQIKLHNLLEKHWNKVKISLPFKLKFVPKPINIRMKTVVIITRHMQILRCNMMIWLVKHMTQQK